MYLVSVKKYENEARDLYDTDVTRTFSSKIVTKRFLRKVPKIGELNILEKGFL